MDLPYEKKGVEYPIDRVMISTLDIVISHNDLQN